MILRLLFLISLYITCLFNIRHPSSTLIYMATFNDIPFEVFTSAILPHLGIRPVCVLAQVNTIWKDFADDPIVWKYLYLQNTPSKILDTSIHIGPKTLRKRDHTKEYKVFRDTGVMPPPIFFYESKSFTPEQTKRCKDSNWFLNRSWCCNCMPQDLKSTLKSWREVRMDGLHTDDFVYLPGYVGLRDTSIYCAYVNSKWQEYNYKHGLSTHNLCQNPEHYETSTLGALEDCKKKKSFKKFTLKILEKERKAKLAKVTREKKAKLKKLEKARRAIEILERDYLEAEEAEEKEKKIFNNISTSVKLA